jgi:DNA polymerase III subunit epsilon
VTNKPIPTYAAIDFETANGNRQSACAIGITRVENGEITEQCSHLIRPPTREFHYYCTIIHGLRWADVRDEPTFGELWPTIAHFFEGLTFIAAHNAKFDRAVLRACCELYNLPMPKSPFVDTVTLARRSWKLPSAKLSAVCEHLDIPLNHHEAGSDAEACARIILHAPEAELRKLMPKGKGAQPRLGSW